MWSLGCILYNMVYGCTPFQKYRAVFEKVNAIMNQPVVFKDIEDRDLLDVMKVVICVIYYLLWMFRLTFSNLISVVFIA